MAITRNAVANASPVSASSISVPYPTNAVDDVLLLAIATASTPTATPSGWTLAGSSTTVTGAAIYVYWKPVTTVQSGTVTVSFAASGALRAAMVSYSGADTTTVPAVTTSTGGPSTTITAASRTYPNNFIFWANGRSAASTLSAEAAVTGTWTASEAYENSGTNALTVTDGAYTGTTTSLTATSSASVSWNSVAVALAVPSVAQNFSDTATLTGTGSLTAQGVAGVSSSGALSGTGALSTGAVPGITASVALSGTGTLSAAGRLGGVAAPALSGTGVLSASTKATVINTAGLSGTGTLSTAGINVTLSANAGLSGTGSLSVAPKVGIANPAALSGTGTLSASAALAVVKSVALSGSGALTVVAGPGAANYASGAALSGTGSLSVSNTRIALTKNVGLTGTGTLSTAVNARVSGAATLSGTGALSATGVMSLHYTGTAGLSGTGNLTVTTRSYQPPAPLTPTTVYGPNFRNITGFSVQEDATPLDGASTEGGVGTINFALAETPHSLSLYDTDIELDDDLRGATSGTITDIKLSDGINSVTADSRLGALVGTTTAKPLTGSFEAVARYYLKLANIQDSVYFDPRIGNLQITTQGWNDDAWLKLKQLCIANRVEIALVGTVIVFRPVRSVLADVRRKTAFTVEIAKSDIAQNIEVTHYGNTWVDGEVVYPRTTAEVGAQQVYTVEAGAILEDDIQMSVSLASVVQPICVDDVAQTYDGTQSVYSVRGSDNSLISAQNWTAMGGKIEVSINPDTVSLHIKITASRDQYYGPYRIAGRMKEVVDPTTVIVGPGQVDQAAAAAPAPATTVTKTTDPVAANDYPWPKHAINVVSPLGYDYRECVDFVAWRLNRDVGVKNAPWKYKWSNLRKTNGNAIGWKHDWELHGWHTDITPYPGCIAWFGTSAGSQGHVAYVQHVTATEVVLEDYNWGGTHAYHKHTMKRSSVDSFLANPNNKTAAKTTTTKTSSAIKADDTAIAAENDPASQETDYASLRIVGTGTVIDKQVLTLPTGAPAGKGVASTGVTVENIFVSDYDDAYRVGAYTATRYRGEEQTITGTLTQIEQRDGSGTLIYPTLADFDGTYRGDTIAQFNAQWAGKKISDFNANQKAQVIDTQGNQVFGNVAGARFKHNDGYYRITTATISNTGIEFSAIHDTMIADFNDAHSGQTIADFNVLYSGMTLKQFGRVPLLQGG